MTITLNLVLSVIKEAVKAETFIKGIIDRAAGGDEHATNGVAYHETAGDEEVHERKIMRGIYVSADKLRSLLQEYLDNSVSGNNSVTITDDTASDSLVMTLSLSSRFNTANKDALARLSSKYIEDNTLILWWGPINQTQAQFYTTLLADDWAAIERLFLKLATETPTSSYSSTLTMSATSASISASGTGTITYTLDSGVTDDIDAVSLTPGVCSVEKTEDGVITITGVQTGSGKVKVFSKHNDLVCATIDVTIS